MSGQVPAAMYDHLKETGVSWVGAAPEHWEQRRFKYVLVEKPKTLNPGLPAGSISFGEVVFKSEGNLSPDTKASYQEVCSGEFLVNPLNLNFDLKSLRTALSEIDVVVSTGYIVLRSSGALRKRFARWLLHEFDVAHMKTLGAGVRQTIGFRDIGDSLFLQPPLEEQTQIAKFLDYETAKMDALIEKQQQLIALLKEKRQAVISHAVTKGLNPDAPMRDSGVEWLGEVPAHWIPSTLKFHAAVVDCKHVTAPFVDEGFPLASIGETKGWSVDLSSAKKTSESYYRLLIEGGREPGVGDIIYTRNATVGEAAMVEGTTGLFAMGQDVCLIRPANDCKTEFLLHFLKSPCVGVQIELAMVGSTFKRINVADIRGFAIALPPIDEQEQIIRHLGGRLESLDDLLLAAAQQVDLLTERRTALISAAVTGKIDVRTWTPPTDASA